MNLFYLSQTNGNYTLSSTSPHTYLGTPGTGTHVQTTAPDGRVDFYTAEIISSREYSAYGAELPGYNFTLTTACRYGFNGQETETDITGSASHTSAEFWMYDSRLGRRWNVDPVYKAFLSNYSVMSGDPINRVDHAGANDGWIKDKKTGKSEWDPEVNTEGEFMNKYNSDEFEFVGSMLTGEIVSASTEFGIYSAFQSGFNTKEDFDDLGTYAIDIEWTKQYVSKDDDLFYPGWLTGTDLRSRLTHMKQMFYANGNVNCLNFYDIIIGQMNYGWGPENWFFDENHSVSACIRESPQVDAAFSKYAQEYRDKGINDPAQFECSIWRDYELSELSMPSYFFHSGNEGGFRTPEHLIGSCCIRINKPVIIAGRWCAKVEVFNTTSIGSGSATNGQSYPRPINATLPQPYTNVSQYFIFYKCFTD